MPKVGSFRLLLIFGFLLTGITGAVVSAQRTSEAMVAAGQQFVESLTPQQRQQAMFPFDSDERFKWNYIPDEVFPRNGLALKAMTPAQRMRAHDLLRAGLSQKGYMTYTAIMELETVLRDIEKEASGKGARQFVRDPLLPR